jgi:DNA repair photolyase
MEHRSLPVYPAVRMTENLSLTSQLHFCGLPLRLDSYVGCAFDCGYCFARRRGGGVNTKKIRLGDTGYLRRVLERALLRNAPGVLAQCIRRRVPIHFGGMSDPFQDVEISSGVSLAYLATLRDHAYPVVISTKSTLLATARYLDMLLPSDVVDGSVARFERSA